MNSRRSVRLLLCLLIFSSSCNMPSKTLIPGGNVSPDTPTVAPASSGMQLRFVNFTDGGSVAGSLDEKGRAVVVVQVEVTGVAPMDVSLTVDGMTPLDPDGHLLDAPNPGGNVPFTGELRWSPLHGGGEYTLVATALDPEKNTVQATAHVTVTGIQAFTPTPPPLAQEAAVRRISEIIQHDYGVTIPSPSMQRFDFPNMPSRSRWIASAFYQGKFYYLELFDDTHYEWSNGEYSDPAHRLSTPGFVLCRPAGTYKILVVFNDYGNLPGLNRDEVLAQVPTVVTWLNGLYSDFATSQGLSSPIMQVSADAVYITPTPVPDSILTHQQILTATGIDPAGYDFVFQIDLDANNTVGKSHWKGVVESGGGIAMQGCGGYYDGEVNVWSVAMESGNALDSVKGNLIMDFNHEFSHLFGMSDNWPYEQGIAGPFGNLVDNWIPYTMFGWTDTDGDGIPEIIDPTPYGTSGPQP
jgi:hypothetical protein